MDTAKGEWFEEQLRGINESDCTFISKSTWDYNCIGFIVGDYRWWNPEERQEHHWPDGVPRNFKIKSVVQALASVHFQVSPDQSASPEPGFQKIVLFHKGGNFTHVALVKSNSVWHSKLGEYEDLEHPLPPPPRRNKLEGYGLIYKYLRREDRFAGPPLPDEYRL